MTNDAEFDVLLRAALLEANRLDCAPALDGADGLDPEFSPRYLRRRLRLVNAPFRYGRRSARPPWLKFLHTAAMLLLTAAVALGGLMVASPEARAEFTRMFTRWKETNTSFSFPQDPNAPLETGIWRPAWLPEGFVLKDVNAMDIMTDVTYENTEGEKIYLNYSTRSASSSISVDNEHQDYSEIWINGYRAYLMLANEDGRFSYVIWEQEGVVLCLYSEYVRDDLIHIAESMERAE